MSRTKNFEQIIRGLLAKDQELATEVETEDFNANIAMQVYEARVALGLSQKRLAELVDTTQSVISRIEDADYNGHSLRLLKRIANALGKKLVVELFDRPADVTDQHLCRFAPDWSQATQWDADFREVESDVIEAGGLP